MNDAEKNLATSSPQFELNNSHTILSTLLGNLDEALAMSPNRQLTLLERMGVIHVFENCHEVAWQLVKKDLEQRGQIGIIGARDAFNAAIAGGINSASEDWMDMINSRRALCGPNGSDYVDPFTDIILNKFLPRFKEFALALTDLKATERPDVQ
jgi:hypothetical protein